MLVDERRQLANNETPQSCFRHAADGDVIGLCRTLRRAFPGRMETTHHGDSGCQILTFFLRLWGRRCISSDCSRGLSFSVRESQDFGVRNRL